MGAFFLIPRNAPTADATAEAMRAHLAETGFGAPLDLDGAGYILRYFPKILDARPQVARLPDGRFLACVGTLFLGAQTGADALRTLLAAPDLDAALGRCHGHYVLIAGDGEAARIIPDPCGAMEVFHDTARGILSSSLLALGRTLPRRMLRRQEALEFVFHGTALGDGTLLAGVRRLDLGEQVRIGGGVRIERRPTPLPPQATAPREDLAQATLARLGTMLRASAEAFGGRTSLALSGGYDTRLLLALCRSNGIAPKLFVYGGDEASDVVLARRIAAREGLALEHIDKASIGTRPTAENCAALIHRNYLHVDGTVYAGFLANDCEDVSRQARHADGALNLHGAAGEVFRNFFGISSRATTPRAMANLFYVSEPEVCAQPFSDAAYVDRIGAKMVASLGLDGGPLSRRGADALYPYFRCRAWFGMDFSTNSRFGHSLLPFYEAATVMQALALPPAMKDFGNFEALMIRLADPALAAHPSAYGHDFSADAPSWPALRQRVLQQRPFGLRRRMAQARTAASRGPRAEAWHEAWIGEVLHLDTPLMRNLFDIEAMRRSDLFARYCNLAYFAHDMGVSDLAD